MHLDASFIIADPRRESKTYRKNPAEKLKCIVEVADEVEKYYLALKDGNNAVLTERKVKNLISESLNGIEILSHPIDIEEAVSLLSSIMQPLGWKAETLEDNIVDLMVSATSLLDENDNKLGAKDRLITEIAHIFKNDIELFPFRQPLVRNRKKQMDRTLQKMFGQSMPLDFLDVITR